MPVAALLLLVRKNPSRAAPKLSPNRRVNYRLCASGGAARGGAGGCWLPLEPGSDIGERRPGLQTSSRRLFSCSRGGGREGSGVPGCRVRDAMRVRPAASRSLPACRDLIAPLVISAEARRAFVLINRCPDLRHMKQGRRQILDVLALPFSLAS